MSNGSEFSGGVLTESVPLGKYRRNNPFVFSFEPRAATGFAVAEVQICKLPSTRKRACCAISALP